MPIVIDGTGTISGLAAGGLPSASITPSNLSSSAIYLTAPAGAICFVCRSTAPTGWLKANGAAISRTTYADLFAAIGTTFGAGDGSTTFALPDLRGEFPRGWDDARGIDSGRAFGSAQTDAFASHGHSYTNFGTFGAVHMLAGGGTGIGSAGTTGTAGSGAETRPRNIALLAIIKY